MQFAGAWTAQGVWVSLTALPVFCINAVPRHLQPALGPRDALAAALFVSSFAFEVVGTLSLPLSLLVMRIDDSAADRQKSAWREAKNNKQHDEKFITSGTSAPPPLSRLQRSRVWIRCFECSTECNADVSTQACGPSLDIPTMSERSVSGPVIRSPRSRSSRRQESPVRSSRRGPQRPCSPRLSQSTLSFATSAVCRFSRSVPTISRISGGRMRS